MRASIAVLLTPVVLAACASGGAGSAPSPTPAPQAEAVAQSATSVLGELHPWIARVAALGTSGTQLFGTVRLTPDKGQFKVTIELRGAKLGNKIPWSIHTGQCGEASSVEVGDRVQYRTIEASADGTARTTASIKLNLSAASTYHVNFYASPTERDRTVSCGPLVSDS